MMHLMVAFFVFLSCSATVQAMTVDEAVGFALQNNPEFQSLKQEEVVARGQMQKASLPLIANPTFQSEVSTGEGEPQNSAGRRTYYGVGVLQEFEIAGQRGARIDIAVKNLIKGCIYIPETKTLTYQERCVCPCGTGDAQRRIDDKCRPPAGGTAWIQYHKI